MLPERVSTVSLDGAWEFVPDPERRLAATRLPAGVPVVVPAPWESQLAHAQGIVHAWYRRAFGLPAGGKSGRLVIRFGSALRRARVWVDGRFVGEQEDGFLPFELDAGDGVPGSEHEIVVGVDNPFNALTEFPAFDRSEWRRIDERLGSPPLAELPAGKQTWYSSTSGLLGSVTAHVVPEVRLAGLTVHPEPAAERAVVRWRTTSGTELRHSTRLELAVADPHGVVVAEWSVDVAAGEAAGTATLSVPRPERWDLREPALYRLSARLIAEGATGPSVDEATQRFGFRTVEVSDGAVVLNGRPIYLRGALDQDLWPEGRSNAPSRAALEAQVRLAQELGLNLLRCHIKVPNPAYLDVADEAGMLVWCELPSWDRFSPAAGERAHRLLGAMVDGLGGHPSIVVWTIVNESWGADLRGSERDRRWLGETVDWLRERDPTRLVVDNSACETPAGPNFHLRTDLADFHAYRSWPDGAGRWQAIIGEYAARPDWLWSPFGDASKTGDEALVVSEFGGWGLPRPTHERGPDGGEPWWWSTGEDARRPAGIERRFREQRLDRIWPDLDALADATQWQQLEGLASQTRELRRRGGIRGYVITELADAFWEPNGLLDVRRQPKAFHDRVAEFNAEDVLLIDLPRADVWGGERLDCPVVLAAHPDRPRPAAETIPRLHWRIVLDNGSSSAGEALLEPWPDGDSRQVGTLAVQVPDVDAAVAGELVGTAVAGRARRAVHRERLVVIPRGHAAQVTRRLALESPAGDTGIAARLRALGHAVVEPAEADLVIASRLDDRVAGAVESGASVLLLARSPAAIAPGTTLARRVAVVSRRPPAGGVASDPAAWPWDGDWTSVFAWAVAGAVPGLPSGGLLHGPHAGVYPDHVITGLDPGGDAAGVTVGMFAGWVHRPAAILAAFDHGRGRMTITTLRLGPEDGPMASALLESILQTSIGRSGVNVGA